MTRAIAAALALSLTAVGALAAVAVADRVEEISTSVTLSNPEAGIYEGVVKSKKKVCKRERKVTVIHDEDADGQADKSDFRIGKDTTNKAGEYEVRGNQAPPGDDILAIVGVKELSGHSFCKGAFRSATALSG
jgi:hypothetical protein